MDNQVFALKDFCKQVHVLPLRYHIHDKSSELSIPLLRSVLGKALRSNQEDTYQSVFRRDERTKGAAQGYVLSGYAGAGLNAFSATLTLIGDATHAVTVVDAALRDAARTGIGRERYPLEIIGCCGICPDESLTDEPAEWPLSLAEWCKAVDPNAVACRLDFPVPLRLQAHRKVFNDQWTDHRPLLTALSFSNLVAAALNRLELYLPSESREELRRLRAELLSVADQTEFLPWRGRPVDLRRWSASQQRELQLRGISGSIELPTGVGPFWPLLAAARWLHLGKNTTHGMGAFDVVALK